GEGSGGGILVLNEILHPSMVYTPLVPSKGFCKLGDRGTIVDFDTSFDYLVAEAYKSVVNVVSILLTNHSQPQIYFLDVSSSGFKYKLFDILHDNQVITIIIYIIDKKI
uniref:Uncharacterized protein n=1 Tax=Solanum lycopersicum TaxID=4081 RepID=A0A3Q7EAG9_SOLLC